LKNKEKWIVLEKIPGSKLASSIQNRTVDILGDQNSNTRTCRLFLTQRKQHTSTLKSFIKPNMAANEEEETVTLTAATVPLRSTNAKEDEGISVDDEEVAAVEEVAPVKVVDLDTTAETTKKNCCALALDIISLVCMSMFTIFFICGASFFHPDTLIDANGDVKTSYPDEPSVFITVAVLFFIASLSIEVYKRKSDGVWHIVMTSLCIFGGFLWFVASLMGLTSVNNLAAFSGLWITGTLFTLAFYTFDAVMIFIKSGPKPLFKTASVLFAWVANILFLGGGAMDASISNANWIGITFADLEDMAGLYISGGVFYIFFTICYGLSLFKPTCNVKFTITFTSE
jgi:hypothetical protein